MTESFAAEVRQALENIPHDRECGHMVRQIAQRTRGCTCDREARIAEAVARAQETTLLWIIEARDRKRWMVGEIAEKAEEDFLNVLGGGEAVQWHGR